MGMSSAGIISGSFICYVIWDKYINFMIKIITNNYGVLMDVI